MTNDWDDTVAALPGEIDTEAGPSQAYLVVIRGNNVGETFPVTGPTMLIGRGVGADLRINDEGVSRFHCKLHVHNNSFAVEDLKSRNGTYCNGEPVTRMRSLIEGDRLQIGTTFVLRFTFVESNSRASVVDMQSDVRDRLTGAFSRRHFMDRLETLVPNALERRASLSLVLVHIDRHPDIANTQGQPVLDQMLIEIATHIRGAIQPNDILARMSAGDFAILLERASPGDTFMLAERLRKQAHAQAATPTGITLSFGIANINELAIESAHDLLVAAGSALNRARSQGGNRTVLCTPDLIREPKNRATV